MNVLRARAIQRPYRDRYKVCQYTQAMHQFGAHEVPWVWANVHYQFRTHLPIATELDHIYGQHGPSEDSVNYMMTCRVAHSWKTNNTTLGRIVALWAKVTLERSDDNVFTHFEPGAVRVIWGRHPLGQLQVWLETEELPEWARLMALDAIEMWDAEPTDG